MIMKDKGAGEILREILSSRIRTKSGGDFFTFGAVDGSFVVYFDGHGHGRIKLHFGQHDKEPEDGFDRIDGCDGLGVTTGKGDRVPDR